MSCWGTCVQVQMSHIYKEKYEQDQQQGTAPIPSQIVHPPVPAHVLADLCFSTRYHQPEDQPAIAHEHLHATALALLHAAHTLESDPDAQQIQEHNQVESGSKRKYFLKRNYAGMIKILGVGIGNKTELLMKAFPTYNCMPCVGFLAMYGLLPCMMSEASR